MNPYFRNLQQQDPEVFEAIQGEIRRERDDLELIASENYVSEAVMEAMGSPLTNKYAEGLPTKRYYGGCDWVDRTEVLARTRLKELFGADGANVQPHSGAQANQAVYFSALKPGDTFMGLNLSHGGHLTHGSPANSSGKLYNVVAYHVDENGFIDMNMVRDLARQHRPRLIVTGASAYPRTIDFAAFRQVADEVGAQLMADIAHIAGLVCTGFHPSPVPYCDYVTTTTHKTLRGPRGGAVMGRKEVMNALNSAVFPGNQGGPLCHVIAAKAVAFREAQQPDFKSYIQGVMDNAQAMAARLMEHGFKLVSGGTDNHLMLVDLGEECSGKEAEEALGRAAITVNKNTVPGEKRSPFVASGIRIGTPAMTTRGLGRAESIQIADWIALVIRNRTDEAVVARVRGEVRALLGAHPIYTERLVTE